VKARERKALEPEDISLLEERRSPAQHLELQFAAFDGDERAQPLLFVVGKRPPRLERDRAGVYAAGDIDRTPRAPRTNRSAEREGFEPSRQVNPAHAISSRAP
jgi:hypothetical protein